MSLTSATWHIVPAILAFAGVAEATTYHTIPQGVGMQFVSDETFLTSSFSRIAFCTWDATFLYFGIEGEPAINPPPSRRLVWYFDTDPQPIPWSGAGTATAIPLGTQNWLLPFFADYGLMTTTGGGFDWRRWDGTSWVSVVPVGFWSDAWNGPKSDFHKVGIPKAALGNPERIYVLGFIVSSETGSETTYASWPNDSLLGGNGYQFAGVFEHWFGFPLGDGLSPNHPSFHDQTLPVELIGFSIE